MTYTKEKDPNIDKFVELFSKMARMNWRKKTVWGLKASEVRALLAIRKGESHTATVSEISRVLQVTSPTVTQMINNLIQLGYVSRSTSPKDNRVSILSLTEKGNACADEADEKYTSIFEGLIHHLGEVQSDQLIHLLEEAFIYLEENDQV
ncbi:MarR family winged helix-turn-helix transcriptional regulator [Paenibacillus sp. LS1]|uniref:MarR family winged helix-turn-helix transcriptional regulator n=1 Tax=Paenibacillus sp. LS1 TaxID=2992120 RepID=UPI002230F8B6|nr:MarR family winged helix-turn-helix transcriptional regulator [Paenibacillus sp. LS1]MCW3790365.1 MarR family winged helix-turn-helix transcriptional regulator [Paenibacillus sp. LS1]